MLPKEKHLVYLIKYRSVVRNVPGQNSGSAGDVAGKELINQFKKIAALPDDEKTLVLKIITAYVRDFNTQQAYAS